VALDFFALAFERHVGELFVGKAAVKHLEELFAVFCIGVNIA
jgi:hypothetical protein